MYQPHIYIQFPYKFPNTHSCTCYNTKESRASRNLAEVLLPHGPLSVSRMFVLLGYWEQH